MNADWTNPADEREVCDGSCGNTCPECFARRVEAELSRCGWYLAEWEEALLAEAAEERARANAELVAAGDLPASTPLARALVESIRERQTNPTAPVTPRSMDLLAPERSRRLTPTLR